MNFNASNLDRAIGGISLAGATAEGVSSNDDSGSDLSNAAVGGIGTGVTIAVIAVIGLFGWLLLAEKRKQARSGVVDERTRSDSGSGSDTV